MSGDAPAPAVTEPASTPAPAADQLSAQKSALKEWKEIRAKRKQAAKQDNLRLVPKDEAPKPDESAPEAVSDTPPVLENAEGADSEGAEEQPPEKEPTWAQKLRADLSKKTEAVKELEQRDREREEKFSQAFEQVQWKIEDAQADVEDERAYSKMLEEAIEAAGFSVPGDWKRAAQAERKARALERQLKRGQTVQQKHGHEEAGKQAQKSLQGLSEKIPEVAAALKGSDAEMREWLRERFALDEDGKPAGLGLKNLERDAAIYAKALRFERQNKQQKKTTSTTQKPGEKDRPASTTLASQGSGAGQQRLPAVPKNEKESAAFLAARRAARK